MLDVKYKDREYLKGYDLDVELFDMFGLKVIDLIPVRKVYILVTDKGNKVLKRLSLDEEEMEFLDSVFSHLNKNGFNQMISFDKTKENKTYYRWKDELYCVMPLVEGRESEYANPIDVDIDIDAIAKLHHSSRGFSPIPDLKDNRTRLIKSFEDSLGKLKLFKELVSLYEDKNEFDLIFMDTVDYHLKQIEKSIELLEKSSYFELCNENDKIAFCHHDLAHHNILIKDEIAYFVDFDYAIFDLRVHDLCNFICKVVKNFAYDFEKTKNIIKGYEIYSKLDQRELEVLYALLYFPQDYVSICKSYYTKIKDWEYASFLEKLKDKVSYREEREEFLSKFKKYYLV